MGSAGLVSAPVNEQHVIAEDLARFTHDPLRAVRYGFPWGEGELEGEAGPWKWQAELLDFIGRWTTNSLEGEDRERFGNETRHTPCRIAVSSGHGIGKSSTVSFLVWWALSTFEDCRVNISANTKTQLDTRTQPECAKWFRNAINADWFSVHVSSIKVLEEGHTETWRADFVPWSEDNPAATAGLHNKNKRLLLVLDEASEIPKIIYEVAKGAQTDANTEIIFCCFGNPTLNQGPFYEAVFGADRHRWKTWVIDSREVEGSNKAEIEEWKEDYGEDSDFFRVRARGLPPRAASGQYIDQDLIINAQKRPARAMETDPLVAGVDFAWGGNDDNVVRFRKGLDARTIPPIKVKGEFTRRPEVMAMKLNDVLTRSYNGEKVQVLFFDSAGIASQVESRLRALGHKNIIVVNFGADSPHPRFAYMRDFMWGEMKNWLERGAIDSDHELAADLAKPLLVHDPKNRIKLEPKDVMAKRLKKLGIDGTSPDDGDALALTFAMPVPPKIPSGRSTSGGQRRKSQWS